MSDVLMIHQRVNDEGKQGEEEVVGELKPEKNPRVQVDLEIEVAQEDLDEHPRRHHERLQRDEHQAKSHELAQEIDPTPGPAQRR